MAEQQAAEEVEEITTEPAVVNVAHLMAYVDEQREEGNAAFKKKRHAEALAAWQRALDACEQADGKPMRVEDVQTVLRVRSVLHSNRGQALIEQEWWRRAVKEVCRHTGLELPDPQTGSQAGVLLTQLSLTHT